MRGSFACPDDLHIVCRPERVGAVHDFLGRHLWQHAGDLPPHAEDEGVEPRWSAAPQLQFLRPPSCGEETADSPRISRGSRCLGCFADIVTSCWNSWEGKGSLRFLTLGRHSSSCHTALPLGQFFLEGWQPGVLEPVCFSPQRRSVGVSQSNGEDSPHMRRMWEGGWGHLGRN